MVKLMHFNYFNYLIENFLNEHNYIHCMYILNKDFEMNENDLSLPLDEMEAVGDDRLMKGVGNNMPNNSNKGDKIVILGPIRKPLNSK